MNQIRSNHHWIGLTRLNIRIHFLKSISENESRIKFSRFHRFKSVKSIEESKAKVNSRSFIFRFCPEKTIGKGEKSNVPEKKRTFLAEERRDLAALEADLQIWELIFFLIREKSEKEEWEWYWGLGNCEHDEICWADFISTWFGSGFI